MGKYSFRFENLEVWKKAIGVLIQELGPIETARFINLPRPKRLESLKRHRQWQKNLDKDKFLKDIFG
jgi:hypothetical protein